MDADAYADPGTTDTDTDRDANTSAHSDAGTTDIYTDTDRDTNTSAHSDADPAKPDTNGDACFLSYRRVAR